MALEICNVNMFGHLISNENYISEQIILKICWFF